MAQPNLPEIQNALFGIAKQAGEMILSAHPSTGTTDTKKNSSDLVTETDQAVENMVSSTLKSKYPDYEFLGEETYHPGLQLTRSPTFVVDPIDGTTNFVHGYPYVCVSLAFVNDLVPQIGVVYNPFTGQLYHAIKNQGAFLSSISSAEDWLTLTEGGRLGSKVGKEKEKKKTRKLPFRDPPEPLEELSQAIVAVEWGNEREGNNWEVKTKTFASLAGAKAEGGAMVHSLRSLGSAELNLCAVASGTLDAYWEGGCWAWDVAAGWVVLKEAGGMMVGGNEGEWEPKVDSRRYLAVRGMEGGEEKQESFVEEFWGHVKGRLEYDV